jgi:hypothetical protein
VDLAVYSDSLAAEHATLSCRLERVRGRLRQAAIEREARAALAPEIIARLQAVGLLGAAGDEVDTVEIAELVRVLGALERLQAWVEAELAPLGRARAA